MMDSLVDNLSAPSAASMAPGLRVDQLPSQVVLRFAAGGTAWELVLPDVAAPRADVRIELREIGSRRLAEASALLAWPDYAAAREWLRCLPDGWMSHGCAEPALTALHAAFEPMLAALGVTPRV